MSIHNRATFKVERLQSKGRDLIMTFESKQEVDFADWAGRFFDFLVAHYSDDRIKDIVIKFTDGQEVSSLDARRYE